MMKTLEKIHRDEHKKFNNIESNDIMMSRNEKKFYRLMQEIQKNQPESADNQII